MEFCFARYLIAENGPSVLCRRMARTAQRNVDFPIAIG